VKQTQIWTLLGWGISATTAGYLLPKLIVANGGSVPVTPINVIITLLVIAVVLILFAIPVFKYNRALKKSTGTPVKRVNPFYAVRLVVLAKANAIAAVIFAGWHIGLVWLQATAPVITAAIWQNVAGLIGSLAMLVAGVVVEKACRIKDDGNGGLGNAGNGSSEATPA
jgi:hypothetical protein